MNTSDGRQAKLGRWLRKEGLPFLLMALVLFAVRSSFADWNDVPSGSMRPTIVEGDRIFVNKVAYDLKIPFTTWHITEWANPNRGDIAVFYSPHDGTRLVKRVVGLPGDIVELRNNALIINSKPLEYSPIPAVRLAELPPTAAVSRFYANENLAGQPHVVAITPAVQARRSFGPLQVPAGQYFMMGDNRDDSFDSRYFGPVNRSAIVGKAQAVVLSLDRERYWLPRLKRFLTSL